MVKLLFAIILLFQSPIFVEGEASVKQISWQNGKIISEMSFTRPTKFTISEKDNMLILGNQQYQIETTNATDSVVTYTAVGVDGKEFVYDYKKTLTQKNIKWISHGLETWFIYELLNYNEFELGG